MRDEQEASIALKDSPSIDAYIRVVQNGAITGEDRGFLWTEDGRLYFSGLRTNFVISIDDIDPTSQATCGRYVYGITYFEWIVLKSPHVGHEIVLAFSNSHDIPQSTRMTIAKVLKQFRLSGSNGVSQYPPLSIGPGATTLPLLLSEIIDNTVFSVTLATFLLLPFFGTSGINNLFPLLLFGSATFLFWIVGGFVRMKAVSFLLRKPWKKWEQSQTETPAESFDSTGVNAIN